MEHVIGVDLGGTKIKLARVSRAGEVLELQRLETPVSQGGPAILNKIISTLADMIKQNSPLAIGIGTPGLVDFASGSILGCTPNLPDWDGLQLKSILRQALQVPVIIDNDANVAAWGEYVLYFKQRAKDFILLTLGTGLGSGMILQGQLYRGHHHLGIGYGHIIVEAQGRYCNCGQRGCLETYVSGTGLKKTYYLYGGEQDKQGEDIFALAGKGERLAQKSIDEMLDYLAVGITSILNTVAPEYLVLGGGVSEQGEDRLLLPLRKKIAAIMSMPLERPEMICLAKLGENAGVIGAALLALNEVMDAKV